MAAGHREAMAMVTGVANAGLPSTTGGKSAGLSPRELEVLRQVAAGRTNREIAAAPFISVPTIKRHLTTVLGKLGLPSRAAVRAHAHDLI